MAEYNEKADLPQNVYFGMEAIDFSRGYTVIAPEHFNQGLRPIRGRQNSFTSERIRPNNNQMQGNVTNPGQQNNGTVATSMTRKPNSEAICTFCKKNRETDDFARSHQLRDRFGIVTCPVLRKHVCEICSATGDNAHTKTYCKLIPIGTQQITKYLQSTARNSTGLRYHQNAGNRIPKQK